jgi:hypothetical protein
MKISFSRHARRRMRLYGISEDAVISIMNSTSPGIGDGEMLGHVNGFNLPIKVVFSFEDDYYIIITAYPLKRGRDESVL